jgi:hypothetical protein
VFHHGDDTVVLDNRSALGRLRTPAPTDAESVDRLARVTDAVSLAFFVFVPDEEAGSRRLNRGHRPMALKLDQVLATVVGDAATGRPMRVAVEVFTAGTPLAKHGVLRPAGELTEDDLPKLRTAFFDHAKTVASLRSTANRTIQAFRARHVEVLSLHFIFLSSTRLFDANTFGADWDSLLRGARATWAEIGPTRAADGVDPFRQAPDISASPYGFHLVSDRYDVVAMIREESGLLYVYDSAPVAQTAPALTSHDLASDSPAPEPTAGGDHETTKQKSRLRWPRRRPTGTAT